MTQRPEQLVAPADFGGEEQLPDIEAYWDAASPDRNTKTGEGPGAKYGHAPIIFTPLGVTLIDSGMEEGKSSTLVHARLEQDAVLRSSNKEEGDQTFQAGTIIGIWTKAGMKPLKKLAGAQVWMANGQQVPNKGLQFFKPLGVAGRSPMVLFTIKWKGEGKPLPILNDYREDSLPEAQKERIDRARRRREELAEQKPIDLDDIPF